MQEEKAKKIISGTSKPYRDYGSFIRNKFGERVQKISINVGFSCPNRDGSKGTGGCTYCNNQSFKPDYCKPQNNIEEQLEKGIEFFNGKRKIKKFLAYFQAYTNTYAELDLIKELYLKALDHEGVIGLVIGTRPDCISEELIEFLSELSKEYFICLELGVESTLDRTLDEVNRCHTFAETRKAYAMASNKGIFLGAHLILGLPGESKSEMLQHAVELSKLPIDFLKIHQLQVVKHTLMAHQYKNHPEEFNLFNIQDYLNLVTEFLCLLRPDIVIERFISESPPDLLIAPKWGLKNFEMVNLIEKKIKSENLWQGKFYTDPGKIDKNLKSSFKIGSERCIVRKLGI
ncbi:TIGR01212 family radical SAM protein [Lutimonas zeaxanthinifaciens]|uniref:TIGR01212 family radical SAM protein n=1 Tax=Lutimonas zeaxanthinifaciens TaxID=3060215 RepID=UPI00265D33F8|nr:TIGR01212 family radical SAM protein [Lutimonas sp. YSD2104]WKK65371.1 TIGR01212 family radical SAM protein [Lutimonas sp. YSD2104]